nr:uncharacterized protein LOC104101577 [Nicotiana tomentosiformis]
MAATPDGAGPWQVSSRSQPVLGRAPKGLGGEGCSETSLRPEGRDVQLRGVKQKSSAQARRIKELETGLAKSTAEIESSKVMADKSIALYRPDVEAAQMQLREEIHARGFELSEEISRAKALEAEARQIVSFDDEDDDEESSRGGSDEELEGEVAPEEDIDTDRS